MKLNRIKLTKYTSGLFLMLGIFACGQKEVNNKPIADNRVDTAFVAHVNFDIMDTFPNGDTFYVYVESPDLDATDSKEIMLYLNRYKSGESSVIDSIKIKEFLSSPLSDNPSREWMDTFFTLNDTTKAYAHILSACNISTEEHMCNTYFDLIAVSPNTIQLVLSDDKEFCSCKNYMLDNEDSEGIKRTYQTTETVTNGYNDILVTEELWHEKWEAQEYGNRQKADSSTSTNSYVLRYNNGKYEKD